MALTPEVRGSQAVVLAAGIFPTPQMRASQASTLAAVATGGDMRAFQAVVLVAARGRVSDPRVRAWTFTLDGHDYYVLRLGTRETLVLDLSTEEWFVWGSGIGRGSDLWRGYTGINWQGGQSLAQQFGSNIFVGDDGNGAIYALDPDGDTDDDALVGAGLQRPFERKLFVQLVVQSGYDFVPCYGVQMFGSIGDGADNLTVSLDYSDDRGMNYVLADTLAVPAGDYTFRLQWQSLGSMQAPGRIFEFTDFGALKRIDGVEVVLPDEA